MSNICRHRKKAWGGLMVFAQALVAVAIVLSPAQKAEAVAVLVQTKTAAANNSTLSVAFSPTPVTGRLLIAVCGSRASTTFTVPTGFTAVKNEAGTPSQGIFYKISAGTEGTITCASATGKSGRMGIHIYEYSGTMETAVYGTTNGTQSSGTGTAHASGSLTSTYSPAIIFAAFSALGNGTYSAYSNTFLERNDFKSNTRAYFAAADRYVTTNGTYTTTATATVNNSWRGQIAAFRLKPILLATDIVDGAGASVVSPTVSFASQTFGFTCQTATATLGSATQKIRVTNTTATPGWQLSIAPTNGPTAVWSDGGTNTYDVNDPTSSGCSDGTDPDGTGGQMTIDASASTVTSSTNGCNMTGITKGVSRALSQGVTDAIPLLTSAGGDINCSWDMTDISIAQTIPGEQYYTNYSIGLTLTIAAQ